MNLKSFVEKIVKEEWGMSESQFAKQAKISSAYFAELVAGKKIARPGVAKKIAKASKGFMTALEIVEPFYKTN